MCHDQYRYACDDELINLQVKAVIFDVGGVIASSPLPGIFRYEARLGLPKVFTTLKLKMNENRDLLEKYLSKVCVIDFL